MSFSVEEHGFCIVRHVLDRHECEDLIHALGPVPGAGRRGMLREPVVAALGTSAKILEFIQPYVGPEAVAVRAIYFDKTPSANWAVSWHQDLLLGVRARVDVPGFGPWSLKEGVTHVQPPVDLLQKMLTVRLHLDAADKSNGALRVLPASHRLGVLGSEQIDARTGRNDGGLCEIPAGGALLMRPLLLHSSSRSTSHAHRRVIHIEYAGFELPGGLDWSDEAYGSTNNLPWPASREI